MLIFSRCKRRVIEEFEGETVQESGNQINQAESRTILRRISTPIIIQQKGYIQEVELKSINQTKRSKFSDFKLDESIAG